MRLATRKILLLMNSLGDGPWSRVEYVKEIEVQGADDSTSIRIEVRDASDPEKHFPYLHRGAGRKKVNIPRGEIRIIRIRGDQPITVYAHCAP